MQACPHFDALLKLIYNKVPRLIHLKLLFEDDLNGALIILF